MFLLSRIVAALSFPARVLLALASGLAYVAAFGLLRPVLGPDTSILSVAPVIVTAGMLGFWPGVLAGALLIPVNSLLLAAPGEALWDLIWRYRLGHLAGLVVGGVVGLLSDVARRFQVQSQALAREIAERRQAEAALRDAQATLEERVLQRTAALQESEARYRQIYESNRLIQLLIDPETLQIVDGNAAAAAFYGYDRAALAGMPLAQINCPSVEEIRAQTHSASYVSRRLPGGEVRELEVQVNPMTMGGRRLLHVLMRDITGQRRYEAILQRYRLLSEHTRDIILFIRATDGRLLEVNAAAVAAYGYTEAELLNLTIYALRDTGSQALIPGQWQQASATGALFEAVHRRKDGSTFPVEVSSRGLDLGGERVLLSIVRDITVRKRVEVALRENEYFLTRSQEVGGLGSYYLDVRTGHWSSSPQLDAIFGIEAAFPKTVAGWLEIVHPDHRAELQVYLREHVLAQRNRFDKEYRVIRPADGRERWVHGLGELEFDAAGQPIKMIGTIQDITERKRTEQALRESEAQLRLFYELPFIGMAITSPKTKRWVRVNERLAEILGYPREILMQKTWAEMTHPDDLDADVAEFERVMSGASDGYRMDKRFVRPDGAVVYATIDVRCVRAADGSVDFFVATVQDIGDRKRIEAELERRVAELQRSNAVTTALAQVSARIDASVDADQAMKTLGEALRPLKLQCFIALLQPDDSQLVLRYTNLSAGAQALASRALGLKIEGYRFSPERYPDLHAAVRSRRPLLFTEVQRRPPSAWEHVPQALTTFALNQLGLGPGAAFAVIPLILEEQVQGVLGVWGADLREVDMAPLSVFAGQLATALERVRLLEAERRRAEELDRSNRLISALADVAARIQGSPAMEAVLETLGTRLEPFGVSCLVALPGPDDADLQVQYLSVEPRLLSLAEGLAGLRLNRYRVPRRAWIVSECLDRQQPVFSRDLPRVVATMLPGAAGGVVSRLASLFGIDAGVAMLYLPLRVEDRTLGLLALWGASLQPGDVPAYSVFAGQVAIALRNAQLVAHLEQARQAAEEANRLKSLFLANVSHELRTPLTGILGSLDLILDGMCDSADEERKFLHLGRDAGQRLLKLINDLLDLARIEAGQLSVTPRAIDLAEALAEVCMLCRPLAEAKQLELALDLPPAGVPLTVQADPDRLNQIMLNLVGNAVKFTEAGAVRVSAVADPAAACVHIHIRDTGIGIPAAVQEKLFQPFVQADATSTRQYGGTGLGLAISRRLAELMRGRITLHSDGPGAGSTFSVSLPLAGPAPAGTEPGRSAGLDEERPREAQV